MIIVEGPDGAGKTTLVQQIAAEFEMPIAPRAVSKETEALVDLQTYVETTIEGGWQPKVYDRFSIISDPIYRFTMGTKIVEPGMYNYPWQHKMIDRLVKDVSPFVIFCIPPWTRVAANLQDDPDNLTVWPFMHRVYGDYCATAAVWQTMLGKDCFIYDYTIDAEHPEKPVMDWLRKALR